MKKRSPPPSTPNLLPFNELPPSPSPSQAEYVPIPKKVVQAGQAFLGVNFNSYELLRAHLFALMNDSRLQPHDQERAQHFLTQLDNKATRTLVTQAFNFAYHDIPEHYPVVGEEYRESTRYIRAGLHLEKQKFGTRPAPGKPTVDEAMKAILRQDPLAINSINSADEATPAVTAIGLEIEERHNRAIEAIQKRLTKHNYVGNMEGRYIEEPNSFQFSGYLPMLRIRVSEYLEDYGLQRMETSRGKLEFSGKHREEALQALRELATTRFLLMYERKYWENGELKYDVIRTIRPLLVITEGWEALNRKERNAVADGQTSPEADEKLRWLGIEVSPIFVDQINTYFVLKPANWRQEITLHWTKNDHLYKQIGTPSKYTFRFIEYLFWQFREKSEANLPPVIKREWEAMAYALKVSESSIKRNKAQARGILRKCYRIAQEMGYLSDFDMGEEHDTLTLNPDRFIQANERERQIEEIEAQNSSAKQARLLASADAHDTPDYPPGGATLAEAPPLPSDDNEDDDELY